MRRQQKPAQIDSDSLQADVMRFMAIIAFCIIAILALVRDLKGNNPEADVGDAPFTAGINAAVPMHEDEPMRGGADLSWLRVKDEVPVKSEPGEAEKQNMNVVESLVHPKEAAAEKPDMNVVESLVHPKEAAADNSIRQPLNPADPSAIEVVDDHSVKQSPVSLRFASDAVFLNLIAAGNIRVYQKTTRGIRSLSPDFQLQSLQPDGPVYELRESSLPKKVKRIFPVGAADTVFLVSLPGETMHQIRQHLTEAQGGVLVVDRNGEVRHEP